MYAAALSRFLVSSSARTLATCPALSDMEADVEAAGTGEGESARARARRETEVFSGATFRMLLVFIVTVAIPFHVLLPLHLHARTNRGLYRTGAVCNELYCIPEQAVELLVLSAAILMPALGGALLISWGVAVRG